MSASTAAKCIEKGIRKVQPNSGILAIPIADGGPGTVQTLVNALNGKYLQTTVSDPLMYPVVARWGIIDNQTAIIEMAAANGLELLNQTERNPMHTTTYGTGELIKAAIEQGCSTIWLGIGGSATNDGGTGMAQALGVKFLDKNQQQVKPGGQYINEIETIEMGMAGNFLQNIRIKVLCDVTNPLTGINGASVIYGPQKGATPQMVQQLDENLKHLAYIIRKQLSIDIENLPGAGAAGGLGAGLVAFANASLVPGFETISNLIHLESKIQQTDIIISTEGTVDLQTLQGKAIQGIACLAHKYNKPLWIFTGNCTVETRQMLEAGITNIFNINPKNTDLTTALKMGPQWLEQKVQQVILSNKPKTDG